MRLFTAYKKNEDYDSKKKKYILFYSRLGKGTSQNSFNCYSVHRDNFKITCVLLSLHLFSFLSKIMYFFSRPFYIFLSVFNFFFLVHRFYITTENFILLFKLGFSLIFKKYIFKKRGLNVLI